MRTRAIQPGDLVLVNHKGRLYYAKVVGLGQAGVLQVEPLDRRLSYRSARAREIVDHWTHARPDRSDRPSSDQPPLEGFGDL